MGENRLRKMRKEKGLTLKGLSQELKKKGTQLSASSLIKYERGEREPRLETWNELANFFNVSVPYLQGDTPSIEEAENKVIQAIHDAYFENTACTTAVDEYLKAITPKKKVTYPIDLYSDEATEFPLTDEVKKFWYEHFSFLFKDEAFEDTLLNINYHDDDEIVTQVTYLINKQTTDLYQTQVGDKYVRNFEKENDQQYMKLERSILLGDKTSVSAAFDDYIQYLKSLRNKLLNN